MFDPTTIGLSKRDMRVYEALYAAPNASLRGLAETTGINRGTVHESIKTLVKIGLVTFFEKGKQRRYIAAEPSVLTALIQERQQTLRDTESQAKSYIDALQRVTKTEPHESFASFYEGDEGVAAILRDVLSTTRALDSREYCVISSKYVRDYLYRNFPSFTRERIKQRIFVRVIAVGAGGEQDEQSNRRWLQPTANATSPNCYTLIYGNKTAFISLNDQNVPIGIVVDNSGVTALQQLNFETIWASLS